MGLQHQRRGRHPHHWRVLRLPRLCLAPGHRDGVPASAGLPRLESHREGPVRRCYELRHGGGGLGGSGEMGRRPNHNRIAGLFFASLLGAGAIDGPGLLRRRRGSHESTTPSANEKRQWYETLAGESFHVCCRKPSGRWYFRCRSLSMVTP